MDQMQKSQTEIPTMMPPEEKSVGALIGSIIVITIIALGGIYFFMTRSEESIAPTPIETPSPVGQETITPDQQTTSLLNQGNSSEISDIEKDLNATNLNNLDAEMGNINAQL